MTRLAGIDIAAAPAVVVPLFLLGLLLLSSITSVFKVNLPLARRSSTMSVSYAVDFASLLLLGLYGLYLLYTGLPVLMQATRDRTLGYTVVIVICTVAITVAIALASGLLLGVLLPPDFAVPESGTARV